uniref:TRASH domain-containing protein n=1 Tax=Amphilophus citrinellus TaxID=61819 RepID=A0A3Q0T281_AMPCI
VDVGDTELIHESSHELSEQREEDNNAAVEKESEGDEAQHKETEAEAVPSVGSRSPPQAACSEETGEPVMVNDGEAVSTPESEEPVTVNDGEPVSTSESEEPVTVNDGEPVSTSESEKEAPEEDLKIGSVFSVGSETQTLPIVSPSSLLMSCAQCKKNLMKGQTAFQRKGSPALFCSTTCLSMYQVKGATKICHNCQKLIIRPQDVILAPDLKGLMKDFCGQNCLTSFNYKKNASSYRKAAITVKAPVVTPQSLCSMCTRYCSKHEVILGGSVHKMCSDACFNRFRTVNNLSMAGCANCGSYCHNKPLMLKMEEGSKTVCNMECLAKYKEMAKITQPCTMCRTTHLLAEMVDNKNSDDSVDLPSETSTMILWLLIEGHNSSHEPLKCFCPYWERLWISLRLSLKHYHRKWLNVKNRCRAFSGFVPSVCVQDKIVFLCSVDCSHEFKKANNVMSVCEYCMIEKITRDVKRVNNKDCYFCSDGCKLLFRHDLSKNWGKHCHSCSYCHCVSKKLVTAQYGGSTEEFCSDDCRSKYTMLFCHVAKCDTCGRKGKLKQSLPMLGEVKHFCDLSCLLQFCCEKVATQGEVVKGVFLSLFEFLLNQSFFYFSVLQMSIQTETVKTHPPPPAKILKNKALLCRPLVQNKGVSCKTQTVDVEAQTDEIFPKMMILPVPVPVYLPVPMNMYSQCTPKPVGLPLPLPVPMFLPVTMNSAERIVETIQEIKQKIPSDPYEAELILMAEMVAEDDENNDEQETQKEEKVKKVAEKQDAVVTDGERKDLTKPGALNIPIISIIEPLFLFTLSKGRKPQRQSKAAEASSAKAASKKAAEVEIPKLKSEYGVDAWKQWIQWRQTQPNLENPRFGSRPLELKEDLLRCTTAELSYGLCCFIAEVKRPNGEPYSPDTVFYLCLGIQQYLFQNGRVENIFMDRFYSKFSIEFTNLLSTAGPSLSAGYIHSRVEEEFLWDCKQLGAYSPIVLLNTLLFFCCKYFGFTKVEQHRQLSFAHVMRCTKTNPNNTKTTFLRFYPPLRFKSNKRKEEESKEDILEMMENTENPLRCPVRLYEFYLSKCSESVKQRTNMFYLHPERCCVPNSPLWFSSTALDDSTMEAMLTRILIVRELEINTPLAEKLDANSEMR